MWKCKDCDEYFDQPQEIDIGLDADVSICPYCGCCDIIFLDEDKGDWRNYINELFYHIK